jgi:hypothetical protein
MCSHLVLPVFEDKLNLPFNISCSSYAGRLLIQCLNINIKCSLFIPDDVGCFPFINGIYSKCENAVYSLTHSSLELHPLIPHASWFTLSFDT